VDWSRRYSRCARARARGTVRIRIPAALLSSWSPLRSSGVDVRLYIESHIVIPAWSRILRSRLIALRAS
jgi:hypothetical protein